MTRHYMRQQPKIIVTTLVALLLSALMGGCAQEEAQPQSVSEPVSGTVLSGYAPDDGSQITVSLAPTASCVVMLKDDSDRILLSFYVRAGDTVTVDVPAEEMYVHFACGDTWYGEDLLFGEDTIYRQDSELTDFREYNWEYSFDPLTAEDFTYIEPEATTQPVVTEPEATTQPVATEPETTVWDGYVGDLSGEWESVHLQDGSSSLSVHAMAFPETIYHCTQMTVRMEVSMNAGTSCKDWQIWGRSGNRFVKLAKLYLPAGDGYVEDTFTFDTPVTFDAIAITPTAAAQSGYSWSMGMEICDVWVEP